MTRRADGELESEVLRALWTLDRPASPSDVIDAMDTDLAYTSIATVLGRLCDKGLVTRQRVGRGDRQSYCLLLHSEPLGETARQRLEMMCATEDGFLIAEKDLELRGGGEVLGARQSGVPEFRIANVTNFEELLSAARDDAQLVLERDPHLTSARGAALKSLLYLFECDEAVKLFRAA